MLNRCKYPDFIDGILSFFFTKILEQNHLQSISLPICFPYDLVDFTVSTIPKTRNELKLVNWWLGLLTRWLKLVLNPYLISFLNWNFPHVSKSLVIIVDRLLHCILIALLNVILIIGRLFNGHFAFWSSLFMFLLATFPLQQLILILICYFRN